MLQLQHQGTTCKEQADVSPHDKHLVANNSTLLISSLAVVEVGHALE